MHKQHIDTLHYITHGSPDEQVRLAQEACAAGARWIQLRIKQQPDEVILTTAQEVKKICKQYDATFIVNDHVQIALAVDADGVHLGKEDASPADTKQLLGEGKIVGGTANTLEDVERLSRAGVDYIGLGPYRFTSTKEKLSPILGLQGYDQILQSMKDKQIDIPVIAIGGLTKEDLPSLLDTGVHGVAISSAITQATNKQETIRGFYSSLNH